MPAALPKVLVERTAVQAAIRRATFAAHKDVERLDAQALRELEAVYVEAAAQISARISAHAGPDGSVALQELRNLLFQVEARLAQLGSERNALLDRSLVTAANLGVKPYSGAIATEASMRISNEALLFVRTFVAEDGLQLADRIWRLDRGARDAVVNQIEQSVIQGHGAAQAAREFLQRGEAVPLEVQQKAKASNADRIGRNTTTQLLTGTGNPMDNAMRLFRTEINRAHGEAYMKGGEDVEGFAGWRYLLSPAHPEPDICDLLSTQNLYGLGGGVYPTREKTPWPAHPNTLSFLVIVFENEITAADRAGKETPMEALKRLTPEQQKGVLGQGKKDIFDQGKLGQGMIRTPLSIVRKRIRTPIDPPPPAPEKKPEPSRSAKRARERRRALGLDEMIGVGREISAGLDAAAFRGSLLAQLRAERSTEKAARVKTKGRGAELVREASRFFPDSWTRAADRAGPLTATYREARAWYKHQPDGRGEMAVRDLGSAVHEYTHRLQHALPRLDDYFQDLHARRTAGAPIRRLRDLSPGRRYAIDEVAQEDEYVTPYQGRVYSRGGYLGKHGALEVMTVAFEYILGDDPDSLRRMLQTDKEMVDLVIGLLFRYAP